MTKNWISDKPRQIRIDASTACQLNCRSCPTAMGETGKNLGVGYLRFTDFKKIVDTNKWISAVELANWGEMFLNPELGKIIHYAYDQGIALSASTGVNLNHADPALLEILVRYRFRSLTCSLDGATQEIYARYRVNGHLQRVIENLKVISRLKNRYFSPYPRLKWQFILFDHNAHEIEAAQRIAHQLGMSFALKLSWSDLYTDDFSPISETVQRREGLKIASRRQFEDEYNAHYFQENQCAKMWSSPQVNYDGRLLGCPVNFWGDYGNCFSEDLETVLAGEKFCYAKQMLLGKESSRSNIPCTQCKIYRHMQKTRRWLSESAIRDWQPRGRAAIRFENRLLNHRLTATMVHLWLDLKQSHSTKNNMTRGGPTCREKLSENFRRRKMKRLKSWVAPLQYEHEAKASRELMGWRAFPQFKGRARFLRHLSCHVSTLNPGCCPHPPHRHKEEELLFLLEGSAKITLPDLSSESEPPDLILRSGEFVFYPDLFGHTITCVGSIPARYLMFKWHDKEEQSSSGLNFCRFSVRHSLEINHSDTRFQIKKLLDGPTRCLARLQSHLSILLPGSGYPPHRDHYHVAIIVLEGELETLGKRVGQGGLIFYPAGISHGMFNPGAIPAKYLVFELHGRPKHVFDKYLINVLQIMRKIREPKCWQGLFDKLTLKTR